MIWHLSLLISIAVASPVKEMKLKPTDIGVINTSVGYSTVIQLSQKPLNVVLGDQSAFRIEYINDSVTIKPLRAGAKSNIFIFTENDRFNLTVKSGPAGSVDYVIHLRRVFPVPQKVIKLNRSQIINGLKFNFIKATEKDSELFLDFSISNLRKKSIYLKPETFRFVADNFSRPIRSIYLDNQSINPGSTAFGTLLVPATNLNQVSVWFVLNDEKPMTFNLKNKPPLKKEVLHAL